jgi:3-oxoacyl-[acyl-carrier protein] reductase
MGEFTGKVVVISGGSRGIGKACAATFAREGAQTVLAAASQANLDAAANEIAKIGPKPLVVAGNLKTLEACEGVHAFVKEKLGRCDVLINNAGATRSGNFLEMPDEAFVDGFALKYFAAVRLSRAFWPMLKAAEGRVVSIIGGAARTPDALFLVGGSVNSACANFAKGLAGLGKKDGVNVNVIHPGTTETDRILQLFDQRAAAGGVSAEEIRKQTMEKEGLRRIGKPEDVAELALYLCSDKARHIQGAAIAVDGGATSGLF